MIIVRTTNPLTGSITHNDANDWQKDADGYLTILKTEEIETKAFGGTIKRTDSDTLALYAPGTWVYVRVGEDS